MTTKAPDLVAIAAHSITAKLTFRQLKSFVAHFHTLTDEQWAQVKLTRTYLAKIERELNGRYGTTSD